LLTLLAANALSQLGNVLTGVALPWYVLQTTGSPGKTALVAVATTVPLVLTAFFGGALVDRVGYTSMSVAADLASGVTVALIPLLAHSVGLAFWQLLVLVFLGAVLDTPGNTARQSLFPDLAELGKLPLERANAAAQAIWRLSRLLGPPLAGVAIAALGASNVLWLDAASFGVSALLVAALVPRLTRPAAVAPPASWRGYLADLWDGLAFVRRDRLVRLLALKSTLGNALGAALFDVILPVYAIRAFGNATALGLMLGGFGGGALLSAVVFGMVGYRLPRRRLFVGALLLGTIPYWLIAATPPLALGVAATVLAGLATGPYGPIVMAVFQERTPADMRGRFFGTLLALDNATTPLALVATGLLLDHLSITAALLLVALANLLITLAVVSRPALRELEQSLSGVRSAAQPR
jgi:MFS family permease